MTLADRTRTIFSRDWTTDLPGGDATLVVLVMLALYTWVGLFGIILGLDVSGLLNSLQTITFYAAVYAILALALNLQWGYAGLFNVGVVGFMAVGVYTMAILSRPVAPISGPPGFGLPLPIGLIGGVLAAAVIGLVAAIPALRVDDDYFAIITLGLAEIIRIVISSPAADEFRVGSIRTGTGGANGLSLPQNPIHSIYYTDPASPAAGTTPVGDAVFSIFEAVHVDPAVVVKITYAGVLVGFVVLYFVFLSRVGNSPYGRVLKAIREDELVANSLGKNTDRFKVETFIVGCALMGLGGILWQGSQGFTSPGNYLPQQTFYIFIALIIGGAGSNTGSIIGGALFAGLLFEGPRLISRLVDQFLTFRSSPNNFVDAVVPLLSLDIGPFIVYALDSIAYLRFILVGSILIYFIHNRPQGLLGHRKEIAASIDLLDRSAETEGADDE
ncbi:branched-chain amino acid ABC transporter permease [Halobacteriales archaeon QS_4_66_20]|nr:MAG: branched-chain amino acid ABC transporter permease [Halobacteriales archaeon QS_4_66_20]